MALFLFLGFVFMGYEMSPSFVCQSESRFYFPLFFPQIHGRYTHMKKYGRRQKETGLKALIN